jgi:nicotinamide phosphoribosyltransferase
MLTNNIILNSDSYKYSQWNQYPEGTEHVYSYIESRGGIYDKVVYNGLQPFLHYLADNPITQEMIEEAEKSYWRTDYLSIVRDGNTSLIHTKGKLPVMIKGYR